MSGPILVVYICEIEVIINRCVPLATGKNTKEMFVKEVMNLHQITPMLLLKVGDNVRHAKHYFGGKSMNNRILKFRMWNPETKVMVDLYKITPLAVHPDLLKENLDGLFIPFKENYPLMQFTGLKDKNGKEIYEGDIIRTGDAISFVWFGYGKFNEAYYTENYKFDEPMLIDRDLSDFCDYTEVIGNIYENPELLNVPSEKK